MRDTAQFKTAYAKAVLWFHGDGATPSADERRVYELGTEFHGFKSSGEEAFDATLLAAVIHAMAKPPAPVFFFIPKIHEAWALTRTKALCRAAIVNKPASKSAIQDALVRMKLDAPPWALDAEPADWLAYGFSEKDGILLPTWCKDKLV